MNRNQPIEHVWDDNRERIHVFGPADTSTRRGDASCSSDRTGRVLASELPRAEPGTVTVPEGDAATAAVQVPVSLSAASDQPITLAWSTQPPRAADRLSELFAASPAETPGDLAQEGTVTIPPGATQATVTVTVNGDTVPEPNEFLLVSFRAPAGDVTVGGLLGLGAATISDDD